MKRTAEEGKDAFYEEIAEARAGKHALVEAYMTEGCPPVPLEGMEEAFTSLEEFCRPRFLAGENRVLVVCFQTFGTPIRTAFRCAWWDRVLKWERDLVFPRKNDLAMHATRSQYETFTSSIQVVLDGMREALRDGWNKLHPLIPCSWSDDKRTLIIQYPDNRNA